MSLRMRRADSRSTNAAAALAAISVGVAVWLSLQPYRLGDLHRIAAWASQWLQGAHLYGADRDVDYPPWAIVTLSPLALIPASVLPFLWVACNLAALIFVARRLAGAHRTLFFLLIAAGAMRTLNQFSLVSLALALAGTATTAVLGPLWLGLALMKPQIGAVFWLLTVWQREWQRAALALIVPALLLLVYALRAHVGMVDVVQSYAASIGLQYGDLFWGQTEVTSWLRTAWPDASPVVLGGLVALCVFVTLARSQPLLGLALASLLGVRHLSYDLILLLPWLATLEATPVWIVTLLLMADPSSLAGLVAPGSAFAAHADRVALVGLWALAVAKWKPIVRSAKSSLGTP